MQNPFDSVGIGYNEIGLKAKSIVKELHKRTIKTEIPLGDFLYKETDYKKGSSLPDLKSGFTPFSKSDRWGGKKDFHAWFYQKINFPKVQGRLELNVYTDKDGWDANNPQFILYIDGKIKQAFDTNHRSAVIEEYGEHDVFLYAYSGNASDSLLYLYANLTVIDEEIEGLYYDLLVPTETLNFCEVNSKEFAEIINGITPCLNQLKLYETDEEFLLSVKNARWAIKENLYDKSFDDHKKMAAIGHTHIDIAWLWTVRQTIEKAQRSFATATALLSRFPNYRFMSSQAFLYEAVKKECPDLYKEIKRLVKEGRWDVEGSSFVEPDLSIPSGESLVRQLLYGKRFFKKEFGIDTRSLWLPDSFGYPASIPQILKKSGIDTFITSKISWSQTNVFPYDTFRWKGIDGSEVIADFIMGQRAEDGFTKCNTYVAHAYPSLIAGGYNRHQQKILDVTPLMTIGYGDGGGGSTPSDAEAMERIKKGVPAVPVTEFCNLKDYFNELHEKTKNPLTPVWKGELYLEVHRGTLTSQGKNKKNNRRAEYALSTVEKLRVTLNALLSMPALPAEKDEQLLEIWKKLLVNQFHDIIPGSSIREVYEDSDKDYADIFSYTQKEITTGLKTLAENVNKKGVLIYNPNPFPYTGIVEKDNNLLWVKDVPSLGYSVENEHVLPVSEAYADENKLENEKVRVLFDDKKNIVSVFDKIENREIIKDGEKIRFVAYDDYPINYDAWDIDQGYDLQSFSVDNVTLVEVLRESGKVGLKTVRKFVSSTITETVYISDNDALVEFKDDVEWHEHHVLLRKLFPTNLLSETATCEIQYGNTERPTHSNTSWDKAKFEFCAHRYIDISESDYGVAIINDCKYGFSAKDGTIGISLIKSGTYPDQQADQGRHEINYGLLCHKNAVNASSVVERAYAYNNPCYVINASGKGTLPERYSLISVDKDDVIIDAVKPAEDGDGVIVRLYEAKKRRANCSINFGFNINKVKLCDLMEREKENLSFENNSVKVKLKPFEIITLKIIL